jgi:NAD(P)-dependent dehydrogenase (short-subunit alcohol dehydrogenase family)
VLIIPVAVFPSEMAAPIVDRYADESGNPGAVPPTVSPLLRLGDEKDMGGTVLYLASRAGAYCNGVVLVVDGGRLNNFPTTQ